jgi:DNA-binding NtrC family response regulator
MPPLLQTKILRVLQEQRFERVGGNVTIQTDVRIIAATHQDLERLNAQGRFRADLYYRLKVFTIDLPPLRERAEDVPLLLEHFRRAYSRELNRPVDQVAPETLAALGRYAWPGNVRELQSTLKEALLRATGTVLLEEDLPACVRLGGPPSPVRALAAPATPADVAAFIQERLGANSHNLHAEFLDWMEAHLLTQVLRHTEGNQVRAAQVLGIARNSLRRKIRTLGITIGRVVETEDVAPEMLGD